MTERLPIRFDWHQYYERSYWRPLLFMAALTLVFFGSFSLLVLTGSLWLKFGCGLVNSFVTSKFFVIGHDACHNSFTPSAKLNRVIGTLSLALSFHVYSLWEFGHNKVHHRYTNLRTKDFVWRPLSLEEYRACSPFRRALQRIYRARSGIGFVLYYLVEILFTRMALPLQGDAPRHKCFFLDLVIFYLIWIILLAALTLGEYPFEGKVSLTGILANLLSGFIFPLVSVSWAIGFVVFFNHTHPSIPWFGSAQAWSYWEAQQHCTLHLCFSRLAAYLLPNDVMSHVVHHLNTRVPLRKLRKAQEAFNRLYPHEVKIAEWSPRLHIDILRRCKLYDYTRNQWLDFEGTATSPLLG